MRSIRWLERPLWQKSAFQLLAGAKGSGKGTYLASLAARVSLSGANVLFVSTEDSTEIDLKPRLVAAGADLGRCHVVDQHIQLPADVDELRRLAWRLGGVGLLVVDPVANHIAGKSNDDVEVRHAIAPLNQLANELDCLLIGVRHPGKDRSRGAVASILGSTAWVDTPRAVVFVVVDPDDPLIRHIQVVAGNRSLNGSGQTFRIEAVPVEGLAEPITLAVELGTSSKDVEDILVAAVNGAARETKTDRARELLLDILDDEGPQESDGLDARIAQETGIAVKTVKNARTKLKNDGLIRVYPDKDETGAIERWRVSRTLAPRPGRDLGNDHIPSHSVDGNWTIQAKSGRELGNPDPASQEYGNWAEDDAKPATLDAALRWLDADPAEEETPAWTDEEAAAILASLEEDA
jgi:hypothetical protein